MNKRKHRIDKGLLILLFNKYNSAPAPTRLVLGVESCVCVSETGWGARRGSLTLPSPPARAAPLLSLFLFSL